MATIVPKDDFNADEAANQLKSAMDGWGTDEKAINDIICDHSNAQRIEIREVYKASFGEDMMDRLESELGSNFEKLVLSCFKPRAFMDAEYLRDAIEGAGTDESMLIEIMCTRTNSELAKIKEEYLKLTGNELETALMGDTSGDFRRLLVALCTAHRKEDDGDIDEDQIRTEAQELFDAGENKFCTDEAKFITTFCRYSYSELKAVADAYVEVSDGSSLKEAIESETSGSFKDALLALEKSITNRPHYFAERLHAAIAGLGTNDDALILLVVSRCERDMLAIRDAYKELYDETLKEAIEGDTSGDYERLLLRLCGY